MGKKCTNTYCEQLKKVYLFTFEVKHGRSVEQLSRYILQLKADSSESLWYDGGMSPGDVDI